MSWVIHKQPKRTEMNAGIEMHTEHLSLTASNGDKLLDDVSVAIGAGEFVAIHGASGAGKSLLATALCGIRFSEPSRTAHLGQYVRQILPHSERRSAASASPTYSGEVWYTAIDPAGNRTDLSSDAPIREQAIGFVPQKSNILPGLSAIDNILLPARMKDIGVNHEELHATCETLNLTKLLDKKAGLASGGEQQRISIARALAKGPLALILDEPTSALNPEMKIETNQMLQQLQLEQGITIVSVTHEDSLATRVIEMESGRIVEPAKPTPIPAPPQVMPLQQSPSTAHDSLRGRWQTT